MTRLAVDARRSIGLQAIALAGGTGVAQVIMAGLYILSARSSAPSDFGLVVAAIALGTTAVGVLDFGTNSFWTREVASGRLNPRELGKRLASKLFYAAIVLSAWTIITFTWVPSTSLWMAGPVAMSLLGSQSFQVPLRGLGRGDLIAAAVLIEKVATAAVFFLLLAFGTEPISALWSSLFLGGLSSALLCWQLTPKRNRPPLILRRGTNPWTASGHYGIATVALTAQSLDVPILTVFGGASAAGVYAAVSRWTQPMSLLAGAFSSASAPHIAKAHSAHEAWQSAKKSIWLLWVAVGLCVTIAVIAPTIVDTLIGSSYVGAGDVLRVLAVSTVFAIANQPLYVFLQARGFDRPIAMITIMSVLLQLVLVAVLSNSMHGVGAAFALLFTQILLLAAMGSLLASKWRQLRNEATNVKA